MKLLRHGPPGREKPGLLDGEGRIRDLSAHVDDIAGEALTPEGLARVAAPDPRGLPAIEGSPRIGPRLVTPDKAGDVDGRRFRDGPTATMIFKVPRITAHLGRFLSLQPGDVISTGTPRGVEPGQKPPVCLKGGEVMRPGIEGLGEQTRKVVQA